MKLLFALLVVVPLTTAAVENVAVQQTAATAQAALLQAVPPQQRIIVPAIGETLAHLVVFVDTNCPYCTQLHGLNDAIRQRGIEIQYIFYPRSGPSAESYSQAVAVWCAADRLAMLEKVFRGEHLPDTNCDNPVMAHYELAISLGLKGTPAIVTPDGVIVYGVPNRDRLVAVQK